MGKTIDNFTEGQRKSILAGMLTRPVIVTGENFATGVVGGALQDSSAVKLFVFTVQSLIAPTDKVARRTRKHQEWLGDDLYRYLQGCDDLVVIADEHHVYQENATAFSGAIRDLDAMATIGLTATPDDKDREKVIYRYPLARAIAERFVKTPVLVGRKDDAIDVETRLRDGFLLLEAKQKAADEYAAATGKKRVNAVMFIVADSIAKADQVAEILRKPGLFAENYDEKVLVIHSKTSDEPLARLAEVEEEGSKVRAIVSVSMLKEGWDVANIFVICSMRPSISDALTEQTLGRGLRLPWGAYTDVELLDTVEVLSHERYHQLLTNAGVLLEGLVEERAAEQPVITPVPDAGDAVAVTPSLGAGVEGAGPAASAGAEDLPAGATGIVISSAEDRAKAAAGQVAALSQPVMPFETIDFPKVVRTVTARNFELSTVADDGFTDLGQRLASVGGTTLQRKRLDVVADADAPTGYKLVPHEAAETIAASTPEFPLGGVHHAIQNAILDLPFIAADKPNVGAARRLADAVVAGAGSEALLASYLNAAIAAARQIVTKAYRASPEVVETKVETSTFGPTRVNARPVESNRFGKFSSRVAYEGWEKSLYPLNWFDSTPERTFANLVDSEEDIAMWARIGRGELKVEWENGTYTPDFYVRTGARHLLVEVKADKDVETATVQGKKAGAEAWARYVTDNGQGNWRYVLISESVLMTAKTFDAVLAQVGGNT